MKDVQKRFDNYQKKRPNVSTLVNFAAATKGTRLKHDTLRRWFNKLVETEDYEGVSKVDILRWLDGLANPSRTTRNGTDASISGASSVSDEV